MARRASLVVTALLAVCASAAPAPMPQRSAKITAVKNIFTVGNMSFANRLYWDFSKLANGASVPNGLRVSGYPVSDTHVFVTQNAYINGGYLNLKVDGGQKAKPYKSGEVVTVAQNIKYASVRTVAVFSEPAGVCNGKPPFNKYSHHHHQRSSRLTQHQQVSSSTRTTTKRRTSSGSQTQTPRATPASARSGSRTRPRARPP